MKRTVITGLFLSTALLAASPVFAADDLCAANLQKINDELTTVGASNPSLEKGVQNKVDAAKASQAKGDTKDCIAQTQKILTELDKTTKKGGAAGN
ncbi:hypothetical protein [Pseudomonas sp. NPDC007930]|uniref:hypothetical protein n=1 Tax=Pseudomonas sp. NPDC007930 TaxID=3364417 RepID=UPI0036E6DD6C